MENYAENRETRFGKMFSSIAETALQKIQKAVMSWAFPCLRQFFQHEFKTCSGLFRKAYKLSCFSVLSPLFSSKSSCFSRFSALVSNHFHCFPHSLNKKWKTVENMRLMAMEISTMSGKSLEKHDFPPLEWWNSFVKKFLQFSK